MRSLILSLPLITAGLAADPQVPENPAVGDIAATFRDPGIEARPRAYWCWLNGDISLPDLTSDLEEAKAKGLGGLDIWDTEAMRNPDGFVPAGPPFMGKESVAAIHHTMREARRLGLDLGMIACSGCHIRNDPLLAGGRIYAAHGHRKDRHLQGPGCSRATRRDRRMDGRI